MKRNLFISIFLFSLYCLPIFSAEIISPVDGKFSNRQALVITLDEGEEAYYSYTSDNPLEFGFAYDGPVLIDAQGNVNLHIAVIKSDGEGQSKKFEIKYTVNDESNPFLAGTSERKFIDRIISEGVLSCTGEQVVKIPPSLSFSIGNGETPFLSGTTLSVSSDNKLFRYVPCTVTNGTSYWRFIIFLSGGEAGSFSMSSVPFEISDWENFKFTGQNLIWNMDNGLWSASKEEIKLDRTTSHIISWQDVAYKDGNPVQTFVLPPKPALESKQIDKSVSFSIDGDLRYAMKVLSNGVYGEAKIDSGLYTKLKFDTFSGDFIDTKAVFAFYLDGIYQGNISIPYKIDRQPPLPPKFIASESGEYARKDVKLTVESEKDAKIFVSLYGPFDVKPNSYLDNHSELDYVQPDKKDFFQYDNQQLELRAGKEKTVAYKAFSYAEDSFGNVSEISSYRVIIDEYNYFIDGNAPNFGSDGTRLHPFNSFDQAVSVINQGKFVHFFVSGTVNLPKGATIILSNCSFTGTSDARFVLGDSSYLLVRDASLEMQNCVIQKELSDSSSSHKSEQKFLVFERAAAVFEDCELFGNFDSSGIGLSSEASIVTFKKSGLTVSSPTYACVVSGNNSRFLLSESHFSSISDTAVNFSIKGGSFELVNSECKVISHLGRIVEATGANLKLISNKFTGDFDRETKGVNPVWKDDKSLVLEDRNNSVEGFGAKL